MKSSPSPLPYPSPADSLWLDAFPCPSAPTLLSGYFARFNLARLSVSAKLRWCKEPPTIRSSIPVPESHVKSLKLTIRYRVNLSIFQLTRTTLVCVIRTTVNRSRLKFIRQRVNSVITFIYKNKIGNSWKKGIQEDWEYRRLRKNRISYERNFETLKGENYVHCGMKE